jgi:hypothetical protein
MTEKERYDAVQAQIKDLLDKAAGKSTGNAAGLGYALPAGKMQAINSQSPCAQEKQVSGTLKDILGDGDGTKATATVNGTIYTVIQHLRKDEWGLYRFWTHWDNVDGVQHYESNFDNVAFFNPASEPVWTKG